MRRASFTVLGLAIVAAIVLVGGFVALGGAERLRASPAAAAAATASCTATTGASTGSAAEVVASTILITSLNAAACTLKVSREDLVLALARGDGVAVAADTLGVTPKALQDAVLGAITKTAADEEAAGRLTATTALALRTLIEIVPPDQLLAAVKGSSGACAKLPWKSVGDLQRIAAEIGVKTGLAAACALGIAPLEAVSALAYPQGLQGLAARSGKSQADVEQAVRTAIEQSVNEAAGAGALSGIEGTVLAAAARVAPVDRMLAIVRGDDDPCSPFAWPETSSRGDALAAVALIGVVDASCQLGAPTFDVFAALASQSELDALISSSGKTQAETETALRSGIEKGLVEAQDAGAMSGLEALLLRGILSQVGILDLLRIFGG